MFNLIVWGSEHGYLKIQQSFLPVLSGHYFPVVLRLCIKNRHREVNELKELESV